MYLLPELDNRTKAGWMKEPGRYEHFHCGTMRMSGDSIMQAMSESRFALCSMLSAVYTSSHGKGTATASARLCFLSLQLWKADDACVAAAGCEPRQKKKTNWAPHQIQI